AIELFDTGSDVLVVRDNGPGLSQELVSKILDYSSRTSTKSHYVSPTRGQLGNALKCAVAAPFVVDGTRGRVEVSSLGCRHVITVSLDQLEQRPVIEVAQQPGAIKTGTELRLHWPGGAPRSGPTKR